MRLKLYVFFVLCIILQQRAFAQKDNYEFSRLDITNGLSDNQVNCIFKDSKGFVWFGTTSGLNRYDGSKFKVFKRDNKNPNSLSENHVVRIEQGPDDKMWVFTHNNISVYDPHTEKITNNIAAEAARYHVPTSQITHVRTDAEGRFWFVTNRAGLYCYNPATKTTLFYSTLSNSAAMLHANYVMDVLPTSQHSVWVLYNDAVLEELDTRANKVARSYDGFAKAIDARPRIYTMLMDNRRNLWISSEAAPIGAFCYNTVTNTLTHYSKDTPQARLNSNVINSVVQADDGKIWLGSDHGGLNIIDPKTNTVNYVVSKPDDAKSLSGNSLYLYKDNSGTIWAGTFKQGLNYYHSGIMQFPLYKHSTSDPKSMPYEDINSFAEDAKGNLWIGTNSNGLVYFNRTANTYTRFRHNPADANSLANDIIVRLYIDRNNKLWIGTYFGGLDCYDGSKFTHYRHNEKDPASITDDRIYTIMEDYKGGMWVGTFQGGFNVFDPKTNSFKHPKYPMHSEYTAFIYEDRDRNKWIGRDKGVDVIEYQTNTVRHYAAQPKNANSLVGNDVNAITQDKRGLIWIGTKDGLSILDTKTNNFLNIEEGVNLPANNVSNIIEDKQGKMWVSTTNGLAKIELSLVDGKYKFRLNNYNELDGLQGRAFNLYSAMRLKSGELVFGGINGFNIFDPNIVNTFKPKPRLIFTDLHVFNKNVTVGDTVNGGVVLTKALSETREITLAHSQNVFDIEFAACDYFNPDKVKFEYKLEGFDKNWITATDGNRKATYTNLDGADYVFKVRTQNALSGDDTISLNITVMPPFFKSPLAYLGYFVVLIGGLLLIRHRGIQKIKQQFDARQAKMEAERKIAQEREEARRMHQLDLMKIKFFTNVSHEFRTPLSLILSPIDSLIKSAEKADQQNQLVTIKRNGKRLLNLVNQLLDFRKMEYNELKLSLKKGDVIQFINEVCGSFKDVASQKQIQFLVESEICAYVTDFDHDKIERILFNLLSNAFKFTPSGGHISVLLSLASPDETQPIQTMLEIKVIDTGIGIAKENQERIFERFFQDDLPENLLNQGSGIGLSITREFVKMQGGTIQLESEPEYGSCFTINLPIGVKCEEVQPVVEVQPEEAVPAMLKEPEPAGPGAARKPTILLVEDNDDLRFYLKDNLKNSFHIVEAVNGKDGWQKALAMHPKLIVSDISMPEMNGIELCKKIKADSRTAEIPVLLLTALGTEQDQLAGLDSGANDYIVKPFNFEILLSKIHNSLRMQQTFKKTYQKQIEVKANDISVVSEDDKFLKAAFAYIELNITNLNFSVEELARHLNLSRVSLYKKLLTLTGKTPVDCIRTIRLKRAVQLLEKSKLSIANVAYEVGFNNAAYFAKVFREEYGILPSEYIAELKNKEKENEMV
ncbi:hybrid sensor histidine kinase/response regulator transcription factor [Mucilaginibacter psychrotolerans]|uniref:histidine kinase n=1 Tax=Mucilaginibacter psychrotolerans TaxID=1524096 RepID=A0A4Y8SJA3_9SPHI|nr:two-component regulator propeller domain-containing protein [Mucilaginibacter psychrotolerans]TFF38922.1 response regulator [Mucilaginibacter psychrotolerans]